MVVAVQECELADAARAHSGTAAIVPFGVEIEVSPPLRLLVIDG
jgi:hypothetical protein